MARSGITEADVADLTQRCQDAAPRRSPRAAAQPPGTSSAISSASPPVAADAPQTTNTGIPMTATAREDFFTLIHKGAAHPLHRFGHPGRRP
jgi:hypothetical protein